MTINKIEFYDRDLKSIQGGAATLIEFFRYNPHLIAQYTEHFKLIADQPALEVTTQDLTEEQERIFATCLGLITGQVVVRS